MLVVTFILSLILMKINTHLHNIVYLNTKYIYFILNEFKKIT